MTEKKKRVSNPSEFKDLDGIEYFAFEEDFIEENIRCIPMVVRFKLDKAGIKLKLAEWVKFKPDERVKLATLPGDTNEEIINYHRHLSELITLRTGNTATGLTVDQHPAWMNEERVPDELTKECSKINATIRVEQWKSLSVLQRFALLKLSRPGHENRNLPRALEEFGIG